uniref:ATNFXL2 n=1 Tax=Arundo donax TaxID=35708 RepID=A0A0A9GZ15_ARUDO
MQIQTLAVSIPASCCATQGHARRAQLLSLMHNAFVGHTGSPGAAHISGILVRGNAINILAVDSTGVRWSAMTGPARRVQCGGITNVSVERQ